MKKSELDELDELIVPPSIPGDPSRNVACKWHFRMYHPGASGMGEPDFITLEGPEPFVVMSTVTALRNNMAAEGWREIGVPAAQITLETFGEIAKPMAKPEGSVNFSEVRANWKYSHSGSTRGWVEVKFVNAGKTLLSKVFFGGRKEAEELLGLSMSQLPMRHLGNGVAYYEDSDRINPKTNVPYKSVTRVDWQQ